MINGGHEAIAQASVMTDPTRRLAAMATSQPFQFVLSIQQTLLHPRSQGLIMRRSGLIQQRREFAFDLLADVS